MRETQVSGRISLKKMRVKIYKDLLPFAGNKLLKRNGTKIEIESFYRIIKVKIEHEGKAGDTLENSVHANLEAATGISSLITKIRFCCSVFRAQGTIDSTYKIYAEITP